MNEKLKKLPLKLLTLAFVCATIFSCQRDEIQSEEHHHESIVKYVSLNNFVSNVNHDINYKSLNKLFDVNKETLQNSGLGKSVETNLVLTNTIVAIDNDFGKSYTFKLDRQTEGDTFYNLIVNLDNNGNIIETKIYEYVPSQNYLNNSDQLFSGQLFIHDNDLFSAIDITNSFAKSGQEECYEVQEHWECGAGNEHPPGTPTSECPTQGPYTFAIEAVQVPCSGGGGLGGGGIY